VAGAGLVRQAVGLDLVPPVVLDAQRELLWLTKAQQPGRLFNAHVHCLCTAP
jgi:hypothetical protein